MTYIPVTYTNTNQLPMEPLTGVLQQNCLGFYSTKHHHSSTHMTYEQNFFSLPPQENLARVTMLGLELMVLCLKLNRCSVIRQSQKA